MEFKQQFRCLEFLICVTYPRLFGVYDLDILKISKVYNYEFRQVKIECYNIFA
jgi:hypothetical protein